MIKKLTMACGLMIVALSQNVHALELKSGTEKTQLIELYTSQGCSSCPPADKWFNTLQQSEYLWDKFIPVAFHVDYWDYIGWADPYATNANSTRQREHKREGNLSQVYTPGFLIDGEEWRGYFNKQDLSLKPSSHVGILNVKQSFDKVEVKFSPTLVEAYKDKTLDFYVARLGFDLETDIKRGENKGKTLKHNFVVLGINKVKVDSKEGNYDFKASIPAPIENAPKQALVVWVSESNKKKSIQSVGGWL